MKFKNIVGYYFAACAMATVICYATMTLPKGTKIRMSTGEDSDLISNFTTNFPVLIPGGGTNTLVITNGMVFVINK